MPKPKTQLFIRNNSYKVISLYDDDLRRLFKLPVKKGRITGVVLDGQCVRITFEQQLNSYINLSI